MDLAEHCRPVAFEVSLETPQGDYEHQSTVVRARSALEACYEVMRGVTDIDYESPSTRWDDEDEEVEGWWLHEDPEKEGLTAVRSPRWDGLKFTYVNAFRIGWWVFCAGCSRRVYEDDEDDDGNPLVPHVDEKRDEVYCSRQCAGLEEEESNE